ncbi:hypothetical protein ACFO9E_21730 [Streptomyces maoxianensis]|uniref:Uncharacterized protein n=1 Tax=Streptomyces maoxianensis TaxID=1459942 RepID=A0ABV9G8M0_9ACTN
MGGYLVNLAEQRRGKPSDDMLSAFVNELDPALRLTQEELAGTAVLPRAPQYGLNRAP